MNRRTVYNIISVLWSAVRFTVLKIFFSKRFYVRGIQRYSPNMEIIVGKNAKFICGPRSAVHRRCKIFVEKGARLEFGENVQMGNGVSIYCLHDIKIGNGTGLGQDTKVYDHDHDYRVKGGFKERHMRYSPIVIGDNCWIGANVTILRGTTIGDNCVIAAGSIVKGDIPANSFVVQKRETTIKPYGFEEKN